MIRRVRSKKTFYSISPVRDWCFENNNFEVRQKFFEIKITGTPEGKCLLHNLVFSN